MFRLIVILLLTFSISYADKLDFMVGLKAYNDKLYDVAIMSLEDYLKSPNDNKTADYAKYALYRSYLLMGDYQNAMRYLENLELLDDERFDKNLMKSDKTFIFTKTDCQKAESYAKNDLVLENLVFNSDCKLSEDFINNLIPRIDESNILLKLFYKSLDYTETEGKIFEKISLKNISDKDKSFMGKYFFKNKNYDFFWAVYKFYKDDDLVNLGLTRLYEIENYEGVVRSFEFNNKYEITNNNFCRIISSYEKLNKKYDCDLLDNCIIDNQKVIMPKTACYIKNIEVNKLESLVMSLSGSDFQNVCKSLEYAVSKNIYTKKILSKLNSCENYQEIGKILFANGKYAEIPVVIKEGKNDEDYLLLAGTYEKLGEKKKSEFYFSKIKDKKKYLKK